MRTLIFGGPRTGKTTHADWLERQRNEPVQYRDGRPPRPPALLTRVRHTDVLIGELPWSQASQHIADEWLNEPGPWIIEGVAVGRALRKWLAANPTGKPCEELIVLETPHVELTGRQRGMAKGCATVLEQIEPELVRRGVDVRRGTR